MAHQVVYLNTHKAEPHQPLCSYHLIASNTYHYLASLARHHPSILCSSPSSLTYIFQSSFCVVLLTVYQWSYSTTSCWLIPCSSRLVSTSVQRKCSTIYMYSPSPSCQDCPNLCLLVAIPRFKVALTATMPIPNSSLFMG